MDLTREDNAITAYFNLLRSKGGDDASIKQRALFFEQFIPLLVGKEASGQTYRDVLESLVDAMPADDWPPNLVIAREFFPFWIGDFKAITHLTTEIGFDFHPVEWMPAQISLPDLWKNIDQEKLSTAESWGIKSYQKALIEEGASPEVVDVRTKLAKVLVIRLRDAPITYKNAFRCTVDATVPLFELKKTRQLFLVVVREFYHFWSGNPDAREHVMKVNKVSIL